MASEYRTVIEGDKEPVPSEERERLAALNQAKHQDALTPQNGSEEEAPSTIGRSTGSESDPGSLSGSSSRGGSFRSQSQKEMLALKSKAVGALPRGESQPEEGLAQMGGEEVRDTIVGDKDPIPEQEEERREAVKRTEEKKGLGTKIKEKLGGYFGGGKGRKSKEDGNEEDTVNDTPQAADLASGWTGADAVTQDASKGANHPPSKATPPISNNEPEGHWGPGIGSGGAGVNESEGVTDDGVIRVRGGGFDPDEMDCDIPHTMDREADSEGVMRVRGGGFDTGSELAKEEAAAETVLQAGAKKTTGVTQSSGSVFKARKNDDDDTDYDHGLKGVGTGKEPAEKHGVNTQETGKVKAPGLGERVKEELQAFTGMFQSKGTEK